MDELCARIKYFFKPPDPAVFQSAQTDNLESLFDTTRAEYSLTLTTGFIETPALGATLTPTTAATPVLGSVSPSGWTKPYTCSVRLCVG
jgi:hypothetical protein